MKDLVDAIFVADGTFGEWEMYSKDGYYYFREAYEDGEWAYTPNHNLLSTQYEKLANKILDDLESFGAEYRGSESSIPWQYTLIDSFDAPSHEEVERMLDESFLQKKDWTLDAGLEKNDAARDLFGIKEDKRDQIRKWLSKCTKMQMTAACCVGNAYYSLNVAYQLAAFIEHNQDEELSAKMSELADAVAMMIGEIPFDVMQTFRLFELYYRIHLEEKGCIIG